MRRVRLFTRHALLLLPLLLLQMLLALSLLLGGLRGLLLLPLEPFLLACGLFLLPG